MLIFPYLVVILTIHHTQGEVAARGEGDEAWFRVTGTFYDPFHPFFIYKALQDQLWMKYLVFGSDSFICPLLPGSRCSKTDQFSKLFRGYGQCNYFQITAMLTQELDAAILDEVYTFLDPARSFVDEFNSSATVAILKAYIDIRYYPGPKGVLALWTPCLCFPDTSYPYVSTTLPVFCLLMISLIATRSYEFRRAKPFRRGITGKEDKDSELYQQRGAKLFLTIVNNSGAVGYKKGLGVSEKFINFRTRGKAVAIGPLEYCGNGIPLTRSRGKASGAKKKESEKEKILWVI